MQYTIDSNRTWWGGLAIHSKGAKKPQSTTPGGPITEAIRIAFVVHAVEAVGATHGIETRTSLGWMVPDVRAPLLCIASPPHQVLLLSVVYCILSIVYCLLSIVYCLLSIVCCILAIGYWLLSIGYCLLPIVCCLLSPPRGFQ
jgi:lysylphosphatidylglycerol synthetase-like protein (DUF2156 family)